LRLAFVTAWIGRAEIERMRGADSNWARLLDHLAEAGPSTIEDLQLELGLKPKEVKSLRAPLERCGAIISPSPAVTAGPVTGRSSYDPTARESDGAAGSRLQCDQRVGSGR